MQIHSVAKLLATLLSKFIEHLWYKHTSQEKIQLEPVTTCERNTISADAYRELPLGSQPPRRGWVLTFL